MQKQHKCKKDYLIKMNRIDDVEGQLKETLSEIMDVDPSTLETNTYLVRDLGIESIDLIEISVEISGLMDHALDDSHFFLTHLRSHIDEKPREEIPSILKECYPHLSDQRIDEIVKDLDNGPVLQFQDLVAYIAFVQK